MLFPQYSLLIKFDGKRVPSRKFFSPTGFHGWDYLNSQYQGEKAFYVDNSTPNPLFAVTSIAYLRGWNRALINFESGLHCKQSSHKVAMKYRNLPGVASVYRDEYQVRTWILYRVFFFLWIQSRGFKSAILRSFKQFFVLFA